MVERLEDLPAGFTGIAATRTGRVWFTAWGEVRQLTEGGEEQVLARRNERDRLIAASELAVQAEQAAQVRTERSAGGGSRSRGRAGAGPKRRCARPSAPAPRGARRGAGRSG